MIRTLRIAVVTTSWPRFPGDPAGHFVEAEAAILAQRGEVVVVAPRADDEAFGWPGVAARVRERPTRAIAAARWVARARAQVRAGRFDRIVAHWAIPSALPIASASNAPVEIVSHGGDVRLLCALPAIARTRVVDRLARRADAWRFVSEALAASLLARLPAAQARRVAAIARVAPCALTMPDVADAIAAKRRAMRDAPFAVCVGRLVASKRVDVAIARAAARGLPLVVVGDGPERARLEAIARATRRSDGAGARVTFVGRTTRDEAVAWIGAAACVLHPSIAEGASTVLREAEALGVAIDRCDGAAAARD